MSRLPTRTVWVFGLTGLVTLFAAGCGGSSSGVVAGAINFSYVPASGPSPSVTTASGPGSDDSVAVVEVHVTDVTDVLSASFSLDFDPGVVTLADFDVVGSHLGSDGATIEPLVQLTQPGRVTVGVTRLAAAGIDFNGRRFLIRIRFQRRTAAGTSVLTFTNNNLLDSSTPPRPIPGVQWFGGTFQVN
ncbi:MAG: hypothetical protein GTN89_14280 [Acidobacteria bacterium]|nr:hypothetical protein [Acidobacteriota bacterium]NIM60870.1 hypothetical protein [Acidobacteriota bacterium]NIO60404.1 hypothetical protein [Acidobacteriota bacterium]NIQ31499.1 hypothetical protein [Acidobacteriota bacterium]NIQ86735.1 hypothetical protein [Acidobacteriota bacterium]